MIYEVSGDILKSKAELIAHGVAANDPMNQGLALSLHQNYPAMHKDFHHWCHVQHPKPGAVWLWGGADGVRIANLLTQDGGYGHGAKPGRATERNVNKALRELSKLIKKESFKSVALPRLATGIGGLDWDHVRPLIVNQLEDSGADIYLYTTFQAGKQAKEPKL